jgi:hypothetical protein
MKAVSTLIRKYAANAVGLDDVKIDLLNRVAPKLVIGIKEKVESGEKEPLKDLSEEEKKLLLAFVVYKRQNVTTGVTDRPNNEDAAKILNGDLYADMKDEDKNKRILKDLVDQLSKAGLSVPTPKEVKDLKKHKGD